MMQNIKKIENKGFVLLFAVTISAILLAIALGVSNIAFREAEFSTSARDANDAFFAADVGIECAFMNDKSSSGIFKDPTISPRQINCNGQLINVTTDDVNQIWTFVVPQLGGANVSCAIVTVNKTGSIVTITSNGYSNGSVGSSPNWACVPNTNTTERQIQSTYSTY